MTRKQKTILALLGAGNLLVVVFLVVLLGMSLSQGASGGASPALATAGPTFTPEPTVLPTWTPVPTPAPQVLPTPTLRPLMGEELALLVQIEQGVSTLRGLSPQQPVPQWVISTRQLRLRYVDPLADELEERLHTLTIVLAAFDLLEPDADLSGPLRDWLSLSIAGFYDPAAGEIYVVSNADLTGAAERAVYAHEFGHALQDQAFGLQGLGIGVTGLAYEQSDRLMAVQALVEGDAGLIQEQFIATTFTSGDIYELQHAGDPAASVSVPRVVREVVSFPYEQGRAFVQQTYDRGGWRAVDALYAAPPVSTEQILHPERYLDGDQPVPVSLSPLTDTLGGGWGLIYEDTVGEFLLRLHLENRLEPSEAASAAEGWGGDRCAVYRDGSSGRVVMILRVAWDSADEAAEFLEAYRRYAEARFGKPAGQTAEGLSCWQGQDAVCLAWGDGQVTVVLGPDQAIVDRVVAGVASE